MVVDISTGTTNVVLTFKARIEACTTIEQMAEQCEAENMDADFADLFWAKRLKKIEEAKAAKTTIK